MTHVFPFPKWGLRKSFEGINLKPVYFFIWFLKSTETNEVVVWKTGLWLKSNNVLWLTEIKCMIKTCLTSLILDVKSKQTLFNLLYSLCTDKGKSGVPALLKAEVNKPINKHRRYKSFRGTAFFAFHPCVCRKCTVYRPQVSSVRRMVGFPTMMNKAFALVTATLNLWRKETWTRTFSRLKCVLANC